MNVSHNITINDQIIMTNQFHDRDSIIALFKQSMPELKLFHALWRRFTRLLGEIPIEVGGLRDVHGTVVSWLPLVLDDSWRFAALK